MGLSVRGPIRGESVRGPNLVNFRGATSTPHDSKAQFSIGRHSISSAHGRRNCRVAVVLELVVIKEMIFKGEK